MTHTHDTFPTRPSLPPMPPQIAGLPVHRAFPVPWFVAWFDGVPDFRVVDAQKVAQAVRQKRCMVCGGKLGREFAFPLGPMCAINRVSAEPPSHVECVDWSARACPFLSRPGMIRRKGGEPEGYQDAAGQGIERNPGVALVWVTTTYKPEEVGNGYLYFAGNPLRVLAYREGRRATDAEVTEAIASGFPQLYEAARSEGQGALDELRRMLGNAAVVLRLNSRALELACMQRVLA
ncbi:hypothetical protein GCM10022631_10570 [Deinococcus rubellus]|uniref:hypothetical protein n=1 Tax=Deinococcus rubellus TaxID=1889240 RepID=UPI0031ED9C6F